MARRWLAPVPILTAALTLAFAWGWAGAAAASSGGEVTRLMFVGDSITGSPGCWRAQVWVELVDAGESLDAVGPRTEDECGGVTDAAGELWDPDNMGIGGITTTKMWVKLARDQVLQEYQPDVIVQLLGTNDLLGGASVDAILEQYDLLLQLYRDQNPSVRVVVGTPPPIDPGTCNGCDVTQAALAAAIPLWATGASTPQSPVVYADLSTGFDHATMTGDGIHPNDAGNAFLAAAWVPQIDVALGMEPATASATPTPSPSVTDSPIPIDNFPPPTPSLLWVAGGLVALVVGVGAVVTLRRRS